MGININDLNVYQKQEPKKQMEQQRRMVMLMSVVSIVWLIWDLDLLNQKHYASFHPKNANAKQPNQGMHDIRRGMHV